MNRYFAMLAAMPVGFLVVSVPDKVADAASFTSTINPTITVLGNCQLRVFRRLNFRRQGLLDANIDRRRTIRVNCTVGTTYNIGLDAGTSAGGTTSVRKMIRGAETVDYMIYQDAARTINWGDNVGVDTVSGVGTGGNQRYRVYGRVPVQTTPSPGRYRDTVTVTLTF